MPDHLKALRSGRVLLMDGAMGTELSRDKRWRWNIRPDINSVHPEAVAAIHDAYVAAGAEVLLTNTFRANPALMKALALDGDGQAICQKAIQLARQADPAAWLLGDIGPMRQSSDGADYPDSAALLETVNWLKQTDALLLETCTDASVDQAVQWARHARIGLPIMVSITYGFDPQGRFATRSGESPEEMARWANKSGVVALGVNCGAEHTVEDFATILQRYRQETDLPLFVRPNANRGTWRDKEFCSRIVPPCVLAAELPRLLETGVVMIGGCCGTTPAHIAAFRKVVDAWNNKDSCRNVP